MKKEKMMKNPQNGNMKRKDKEQLVLQKGESQRLKGGYDYRWTGEDGKRHSIYAKTLEELREKEKTIIKDQLDQIKVEARYWVLNDVFALWKQLKRGLKDNTFQNYVYMYGMFVEPQLGKKRIAMLVKSDIKRFYNMLVDERGLSISTVDNVHTVLHQVLDMAVDDNLIRRNPADNVLKELKQARDKNHEKRQALTVQQQEDFLSYIKEENQYRHWYPVFAVMLGTGLRVGEAVGLRWCDIDLEKGIIDVNHTLVYYKHAVNGCYCNIHSTKTAAGTRIIPMIGDVREAFLLERRNQEEAKVQCRASIDGYTDFIFVNRFGDCQHQGTLNKALRRIIRDYNDKRLDEGKSLDRLLPYFSCHILRHTFATRMCEAGVNIKVIQETLGHSDVATTLNIYTDVTREFQKTEFSALEVYLDRKKNG